MWAEQQAALDELLKRSRRDAVPIRRAFVQARQPGGGPGPLASFVTDRRRRALDLYLLLHAAASRPPWTVELSAVVWGRLLGLTGRSAAVTVSRQWAWLEQSQLVTTARAGRRTRVTLLREDASGAPYRHPAVGDGETPPDGDYFMLPHAYWRAGMQDWVDTRSKAMLLIALSLGDNFIMPLASVHDWYGLSRDSARAGLRGLRGRGFLDVHERQKPAPLSPLGYTYERRYRLRPPFARSN